MIREGWELRRLYLQGIGARESHEKNGLQWLLPECPFCGKAWHLYVSDATGSWICFKCTGLNDERGKHVRFIPLVAAIEGIDEEDAAMLLAEGESRIISGLMPAPEEVGPLPDFFDTPLPPEFEPVISKERVKWPKYLTTRCLSRKTVQRFNLGFCTHGRYKNRIILPIECPKGRSYTARLAGVEGTPPYLSGAFGTRLIFGWYQALEMLDTPWFDELVINEGAFDAMSCQQVGLPAVATQGMRIKKEQIDMFVNANVRRFTILLDKTALSEALQMATQLGRDKCRIGKIPYKDANAALQAGDGDAVVRAYEEAKSWHEMALSVSLEKTQNDTEK